MRSSERRERARRNTIIIPNETPRRRIFHTMHVRGLKCNAAHSSFRLVTVHANASLTTDFWALNSWVTFQLRLIEKKMVAISFSSYNQFLLSRNSQSQLILPPDLYIILSDNNVIYSTFFEVSSFCVYHQRMNQIKLYCECWRKICRFVLHEKKLVARKELFVSEKPQLRDVIIYNFVEIARQLTSYGTTILNNREMYHLLQFYRLSSATVRAPRSNHPKFRPADTIGNAGPATATSDSQLGLAREKKA